MRMLVVAIFAVAVASGCDLRHRSVPSSSTGGGSRIPRYACTVVRKIPHDPLAFTQGLLFHRGFLIESTGLYSQSRLVKVNPETGQVVHAGVIPSSCFAEGVAVMGEKIYQLTLSGKGFIYDRELRPVGEFSYDGRGWGLTSDGRHLIMSDGTDRLHFLDPKRLRVRRVITVRAEGRPVNRLNELEYVNGEVFANIWRSHLIARIDPRTGEVRGWIDLSAIAESTTRGDCVPNGIAYDASSSRLYLTGKLWRNYYEVTLAREPEQMIR